MFYSYWVWISVVYLCIMTYKDFKWHKGHGERGWVDDRYNWFMFGMTLSLLSHVSFVWWLMFVLAGVVLGLRWFLLRFDVIGEADVQCITWIFYGFGIIDVWLLAWFVFFFLVIFGVWSVLKLYVFKIERGMPFFIVLLCGFVVTALVMGLF